MRSGPWVSIRGCIVADTSTGGTNATEAPLQIHIGYAPIVKAREGRLFFARSPVDGPIFETRQEAENWCIEIIIENDYRGGPLAEAIVRPFKGKVSTLEVEPDHRF